MKKLFKLDATITNLTVRQACASYYKAMKDSNYERANRIKGALRCASKRLREALDLVHHDLAHKKLTEDEYHKARTAETNLLHDLSEIKAVSEHQLEAHVEERPTLGAQFGGLLAAAH